MGHEILLQTLASMKLQKCVSDQILPKLFVCGPCMASNCLIHLLLRCSFLYSCLFRAQHWMLNGLALFSQDAVSQIYRLEIRVLHHDANMTVYLKFQHMANKSLNTLFFSLLF